MATLWKWFLVFLTSWVVSFYLYPPLFTFLPGNAKLYLAVVGLVLMTMHILRTRDYTLDRDLLRTLLIAGLYSVVNLFATNYNGFADYSYGNYITSALVWIFGAYTAVTAIRWTHGTVNLRLVTYYMAGISAVQCLLALAIDNFEPVKTVVDSIFFVDQGFIEHTNRLYGIGAMLDPAGTRFAVILIFIAYVLSFDSVTRSRQSTINWLIISYIIIVAVGNMISRTTVVGIPFSLLLFAFSMGSWTEAIAHEQRRLYKAFFVTLLVAIPLGIFLYNTSDYFYTQMRYGFEGFFSLVEKGRWETSSNNVLATMWRWPETTEAWIIGYGEFGGFRFGTDIGYCRLILYSGVVGFSVFASMFIYQIYAFTRRYPYQMILFVFLAAMSFIIWIKVSTDLFQFWALLYVFRDEELLGPSFRRGLIAKI
ncbi:MAG: hypothetical protein SPK09_07205 [Porphyromonas sp.]|nr:hypothetical protein [Porphyromonas sp.]